MRIYQATTNIRDYHCKMIVNAENTSAAYSLVENYWVNQEDKYTVINYYVRDQKKFKLDKTDTYSFIQTYWKVKCIAVDSLTEFPYIISISTQAAALTGIEKWTKYPCDDKVVTHKCRWGNPNCNGACNARV